MKRNPMTARGAELLRAELKRLKSEDRPNVIKAMQAARAIGMKTVGLTGGIARPGGDLAAHCDLVLNVPSDATPHIQEAHLWVEHLLCEIVEKRMFAAP